MTIEKEAKTNAYYNGSFLPKEKIRIPLSDRAIFFGDGIYEAAPGKCGKIFFEEEHLNRFFKNAETLDIPVNYTREELKDIFGRLIESSGYESFFLYFQLTRFSNERSHAYEKNGKSNLLVTISPLALPSPNKTLKLILREDKRYKLCNIKTLNLIPAVIASHEAETLGADEAVFSRNGVITECAHSNIHIIRNETVFSHPLDEYILPGISRAHLIAVCKRLGVKFEEGYFTEKELFSADEVLVTSSSKLCLRAEYLEKKRYSVYKGSIGDMLCREMFSDFSKLSL